MSAFRVPDRPHNDIPPRVSPDAASHDAPALTRLCNIILYTNGMPQRLHELDMFLIQHLRNPSRLGKVALIVDPFQDLGFMLLDEVRVLGVLGFGFGFSSGFSDWRMMTKILSLQLELFWGPK